MLVYGIINFHRAFPEIAINFTLSRTAVQNTARDFLIGRHFDVSDYQESIIFTYDNQAKLFLEKELGVDRATNLTQDSIDVWYWSARFFKPLEKLEYSLHVAPNGKIIGFERKILESDNGASLETDVARTLAEVFLSGPMGEDLNKWELIETDAYDRENRRDHTFTWEQLGFNEHDAKYRMEVQIQGAEVGGFHRYLEVPQTWQRDFQKMRSQNTLFQSIATFLYILMSVAMFIYFIIHVRDRQIAWKIALIICITLAVGTAISVLNSLPLTTADYDTTDSYSAFISKQALGSILSGLGAGVMLLIMFGAGERLYRRDNPDKLFISKLFSRRGYRSREFLQATLMGYLFAAFHIGFVVFYYVIGGKLGFWSPADVKYENTVSTILPWIFPLVLSMSASLSEEFMFRLFGIAFFKKLFRSTTVAVILQAFLWGFMHSNYPQSPGFVRGLEVGLIGILAGVIMLRFGIWATLTWHFVVDAVFIGLFLFQSDNAYFWTSGIIVCAGLTIPALIAGFIYLRRRAFEPVDDITNRVIDKRIMEYTSSTEPVKTFKPDKVDQFPTYQPLSYLTRRLVLIIGALGCLLAVFPLPKTLNDSVKPNIDRIHAREIADWALKEKYGVSPDLFKISIIHSSQNPDNQLKLSYLKKYCTSEEAERILLSSDGAGFLIWDVRYKREFDPEFYSITVGQRDGEFYILHVLPDSASGAQLIEDEAETLAIESFNDVEPGYDLYQLIKTDTFKLPNRTDYYFIWETIEPVAGDAHFRRNVRVYGDEVQNGRRTLKIPEEWERHEQEHGLRWSILAILQIVVLLGGGIIALKGIGKQLKLKSISWQTGVIVGIVVFMMSLINEVNMLPQFWRTYPTSNPMSSFIISSIMFSFIRVILFSSFVAIVITVANTLTRGICESHIVPWQLKNSRNAWSDGFILTIGLLGFGFGLIWIINWLELTLKLPVHSFTLQVSDSISDYQPWFSMLYKTIFGGLLVSSLIMICYITLSKGFKSSWLRLLALIALSVAAIEFIVPSGGNLTLPEFLWNLVKSGIAVFAGYFVIKYWLGSRLWVLFAVWLTGYLIIAGLHFLRWGDTPYKIQGWIMLVLALIPLLSMLIMALKSKSSA
jgi:hypothetical protein